MFCQIFDLPQQIQVGKANLLCVPQLSKSVRDAQFLKRKNGDLHKAVLDGVDRLVVCFGEVEGR